MSSGTDARLREAFEELERYLADQVAPLFAAEELEVLLDYPPAVTAEALDVWARAQFRARGGGDGLADLAYHALKKIQLFEEFNLLPADRFAAFLAGVAERLIELAPEGEREALAERLVYLRQVKSATVPTVERLLRAPDAGEAAAPVTSSPAGEARMSEAELRAFRRFTRLLDRLPASSGEGGEGDSSDIARQLLVIAASDATRPDELEQRLARLQEAGVAPAVSRNLVGALSAAIPDWVLRKGSGIEVVSGEPLEAVHRVVQLAGDRARTTERWKDLLRAAAESFNEGAYARAVTLLDLAARMVADGEVDTHVADLARGSAHGAFEPSRLLSAAASEENRPILRRLVEFFPRWSIRELLDDLVFLPDPKKRRLVLTLLEVWGADAYRPVLERLATAVSERSRDPNAWWYHRNLVFLLHRLPRPEEVDPKQVLELAGPFSGLGHHPSFQRETFTLLMQLPGGLGGTLLAQRLAEAERALAAATPPPHEPHEMEKILNSLAVALARSGSPAARRALLEHGLAQRQKTGEASRRLRELGAVDLAGDREALSRLLEAARFLRPKKLLGIVVGRNEETLADVARALAATTDPAARRLLAELAEQFPGREIGEVAAASLASGSADVALPAEPDTDDEEGFAVAPPAAAPRPRASLAGDLEVFGLPGLLQNFQQSETSGRLVLRRPSGDERAVIELVEGRLVSCSCDGLEGETAFYQLFERPAPGTFELVRATAADVAGRPRGTELMGLLLEAMRRFDEFQRLRILLPDETRLSPGDARPTPAAGEDDGELMRRLWTRLRGGATVAELEIVSQVDGYRARALLAHWLDEGAVSMEGESAAAAG